MIHPLTRMVLTSSRTRAALRYRSSLINVSYNGWAGRVTQGSSATVISTTSASETGSVIPLNLLSPTKKRAIARF